MSEQLSRSRSGSTQPRIRLLCLSVSRRFRFPAQPSRFVACRRGMEGVCPTDRSCRTYIVPWCCTWYPTGRPTISPPLTLGVTLAGVARPDRAEAGEELVRCPAAGAGSLQHHISIMSGVGRQGFEGKRYSEALLSKL